MFKHYAAIKHCYVANRTIESKKKRKDKGKGKEVLPEASEIVDMDISS
jgi:hypothetical protein